MALDTNNSPNFDDALKLVKEITGHDVSDIDISTDPELLGGLQIETQNTRWDLSLRGQLQKINHTLTKQ